MKSISKIASSIAPSATLAISAMAKQMQAEGIDVVNFGAGEPDFDTPEYIKAEAVEAIRKGYTKYTPAAGLLQLRKEICGWIYRHTGLEYAPNQIVTASGAKHSIFLTLQTLVNPGDEVILPAPYWVTYEEAIKMCGGIPVILKTEEKDGFKLSPAQLEAAITPRTKCFILTNPSNPTGVVYNRQELEALAELLVRHDLYVISDEIYCSLVYEGDCVSIASLGEDIRARTVMINGVSKEYSMTGWRVGFSACSDEIAAAMSNYVSHSTGATCTISQYAAIEAYSHDAPETKEMKEAFRQRRDYFMERMSGISGVSCVKPAGAFYVFMNISDAFGASIDGEVIHSSANFAALFLKYGRVAVVPGSAFGCDGFVRWSYATSLENIGKGLDRLEEFLGKLQKAK